MKKILSTILASSMLLSTLAMTVTAQEISTNSEETAVYTATLTASESDFTFVSGVITEYTGSGGDVVIPSTIGGQAVTSIGASVFQNVTSIESVTMPSTLQRIESFAFDGCSNLRSVDLNDGLQYLGLNSFANTTNLSNIWIPSSVTELAQGVFFRSGLTSAYVPATVTVMGTHVFEECTSLTSVIYMATHNEVPWCTFLGCSSLSSVYIGEGVTFISVNAFKGCSSLTSIPLPSTLQSIGQYAFSGCSKIEKLDFTNTQLTFVDFGAFLNCISLKEAIFPYGFATFSVGNDITYEKKGQFYGCTSLEKIWLPSTMGRPYHYIHLITSSHPLRGLSGVTVYGYDGTNADKYANYQYFGEIAWSSLGDVASENKNLTLTPTKSPQLPTKADMTVAVVTPIPTPNASAESDFVLGDGGVITGYTGTGGEVVIPSTIGGKTVYGIGANAFQNNTVIESVTFPNTLQRIESFAFDGCVNLSSVTLNEGLQYLGLNSFAGTSSLSSVWIPSSLTQLAQGVFYQSGLTSAYVPATVKSMGGCVFQACENLTDAIIMADIATLPTYTFHKCTKLENVYLREGITTIGANAFESCKGLQEIILPTTTKIIESAAFSGCSSLQKMDMSNTQLTTVNFYAFQHCTSLTEVIFPYGFTTISYVSDKIMGMYHDLYGDEPKSVFLGCSSLTKVVMPSTVTGLHYYQQFLVSGSQLITGHFPEVFLHPFKECNENLVIYGYDGTHADALANATYAYELGWSSLGSVDSENKNQSLTPNPVPTLPTAPTVASTPTETPTTPQVDSNTKTATPSDVKVMVNGSVVGFAPYSIDGFNYFKLTDMAFALDGTGKQFQVTWDMEKSAINMVTGSAHKHLGNEMEGNSGKSEVAERFTSTVYKNGEAIDVLVYTIDGSSYFQLDTLKSVLGIDVGWDGATGTITITS